MNLTKFATFFFVAVFAGGTAFATDLTTLSQSWVKKAFSNKTWVWENGHAYFAPDGTFQAVEGQSQSGTGTWYTARGGKLCMRGDWRTRSGDAPVIKCWRHAVDSAKNIWQAEVDAGFLTKWSRFDLATQLRRGNIYADKFDAVTREKETVKARRMTQRDLKQLYAGKTWRWEDGHAYFAPNGTLRAVSGGDSFGEGKWFVRRDGQMCMDAVWSGRDYSRVRSTRCWAHAQNGNKTIWQLPVGDDGIWSRLDTRKDLVRGDIYARQFKKVKSRMSR